MKKALSLLLAVFMIVSVFVITPVASSAEDGMLIRYKSPNWEYVVYADEPDHAAPEGWLEKTDSETWTTARGGIGAQSWGSWTTRVGCQYYAMFLRHDFTVTNVSAVKGLTLYFLYDENPTVYVNGTKVLSLSGYHDSDYAVFNLDAYVSVLHEGTNTLQIAIKNVNGGGGCDAALVSSNVTSSVKGVAKGSVWEFAFTANNSEASAPAGFIEGQALAGIPKGIAPFADPTYHNDPDAYTVFSSGLMTVYFRQFFSVPDADAVSTLTMDIKYDQDPVVYLNGTQVYTASGWHDSGFVTVDLGSYKNLLTDGTNWVVVKEINPSGGGGAMFDMSLIYTDYYTPDGRIAPASASRTGMSNFGSINDPSNVLDGNQDSVCGSGWQTNSEMSVTVNFAKSEMVSEIFVQCKQEGTTPNADGTMGTYDVYTVSNGVRTLVQAGVPAVTGSNGGYTVSLASPVEADAVTVVIASWQGSAWACVADILVTPSEQTDPSKVLTLGKYGSGWENWSGGTGGTQTELLVTVKNHKGKAFEDLFTDRNCYTWELTITDEDQNTTVVDTLKPSSYYGSGLEIYRFEPAIDESFVPKAGAHTYTVNLRILQNGSEWYYGETPVITTTPADFVPVHAHSYADEVTTPATCAEAGVRTYTCSVCGHVYTEEIEAAGHTFGDWSYNGTVTFTAGTTKTRTCTECGAAETEDVAKAKLGLYENVIQTVKDGKKCVAVVTTIKAENLDFECIDYVAVTLRFSQGDEVVKTVTQKVHNIYTTVTGIATTNESISASQGSVYIENVDYLFAINLKGVPEGAYTLTATVEAVADGAAIADTTVERECALTVA